MSSKLAARGLGAIAVAVVAMIGIRPMPQTKAVAAASQTAQRLTLRVGMWTLWHNHELVLTPLAGATMRICERCPAKPVTDIATIRAEGNEIAVNIKKSQTRNAGVWLGGAVTLTAHRESITLHSPVAISARAGVLVIAVTLPVERYVEQVVASESGPGDSPETLKALAIVSRSYALHVHHGHADYDVCDSTHCQLLHWAGNPALASAAQAAALATASETLWFRGQRALSYFSKDCGGRTASPAEVWEKAKPVPYLPSRADRYCTTGRGAEWATELSQAELSAALASRGLAAPGWRELTVSRRGESGRAVTLRLDQKEISAEEFRLAVGEALGWNKIPSTWFEVSRQGGRFFFHGRGWGHGVGLCQKGASAMGAQGRTSNEILAQYFSGAAAADEASGKLWTVRSGNGFTLESLEDSDFELLPQIERARAEASELSGLNEAAPVTVRSFPTTQAFRDATLEPGWVAAFTRGNWIATQPLHTLAARHLLTSTLRHEFLHALIEQQAGTAAPRWLREGLAEEWASPDAGRSFAKTSPPALSIRALDELLARESTENQSTAAHRAAGWYAAQLLDRYGRAQVLDWLRSGIPDTVVRTLRER